MAPIRPGQLGGWIGQGFGAQLLRWGGFGEYPPSAPERGSTGAGRSLGAARGGARNWCPRRVFGPMNSAWAEGRGRRAALWHSSLCSVSSSNIGRASNRSKLSFGETAAPTGSKAGCNCEGFWRVYEYRLQVPAVLECRTRSHTPAERRFQRVPLQSARAGERPLLQTSCLCNYSMTSRIFSRYTRCFSCPSCV